MVVPPLLHCIALSSYDGLELWHALALALGSALLAVPLRRRMLDTCCCT